MKTVILCGGRGLRYSDNKPKGLALIAGIPIIQRVMDIYYSQAFNDFLLILGHKGNEIESYFKNFRKYKTEFVYIDNNMNKGGALKLAEEYIDDCSNPLEKCLDNWFCTYCDCLADIDLRSLYLEHIKSENIATITAIKPYHDVGVLTFGEGIESGKILKIEEKPQMSEWANGGFFVFNKRIFDYVYRDNDDLETDIFGRLIKEGKLGGYKHNGLWNTVNSVKEELELNKLYGENEKWKK